MKFPPCIYREGKNCRHPSRHWYDVFLTEWSVINVCGNCQERVKDFTSLFKNGDEVLQEKYHAFFCPSCSNPVCVEETVYCENPECKKYQRKITIPSNH